MKNCGCTVQYPLPQDLSSVRVLKMSMFTKDPFGSDGSIPLSDRNCCENGPPPETAVCMRQRNGAVSVARPQDPARASELYSYCYLVIDGVPVVFKYII